jgi:CDP-glucose 4,6-dehydratase
VRALYANDPVLLRRPAAVRPWQHVLDPLSGYVLLAARVLAGDPAACTALNFGPDPAAQVPVSGVVETMLRRWPQPARVETVPAPDVHEEAVLTLDSRRAAALIGWRPVWGLTTTLERTVDWYAAWRDGGDARDLCLADLAAHAEAASAPGPALPTHDRRTRLPRPMAAR